jgi:hypothetical protein
MRRTSPLLFSLAVAMLLIVPSAEATTVLRLNLEQMVSRAGNIFRATVLDVRSGSVNVGGGKLPTTTYTLRVDESFKGTFDKEGATVMVGNRHKFSVLPDVPRLDIGSDYLLMTTTPSPAGLSTTVGLGQGAFSIFVRNRQELAVNAVGNANIGQQGAVAYTQLAADIRAALGQ